MCRDISFHSEIQIVTQDFKGIQLAPSLAHYPNEMVHVTCEVLPTHPIVVNRKALVLANMSWGIVNTWIDDPGEVNRANWSAAYSEQGFTPNVKVAATLSGERVWYDKPAPAFGQGQ